MAYNGTIVGSPTFTAAGKFAGTTALAGLSDNNYVSCPNGTFAAPSSGWTVECWLELSSTSGSSAISNDAFLMGVQNDGGFFVSLNSNNVEATTPKLTSGSWQHCAIVVTPSKLLMYVNGSLALTVNGSWSPSSGGAGDIGRYTGATGFSFPGAICETAVWNVAKYTSNFTPPTSPYLGTETGLRALFHLNGNVNDSVVATVSGNLIAPNDAAIVYSPFNWNVTASVAQTISAGAYFRTIFSGTSVGLACNTANSAAPFTELWARVDNGAWQELTLSAGNPTLAVASGLVSRNHLLEVVMKSSSVTIDRWGPNSQTMIQITGILLDSSATVEAPLRRTKNVLIYGDSITEGWRSVSATLPNDTDNADILGSYGYALTTALDAEIGIVAFSGQGITVPGGGSVPIFTAAYNLIFSGVSRSFTAPLPDLVIYNQGTNDTASISSGLETVISGILSEAPNSVHLLLVPFNQTHVADIQAVVAALGGNVGYASTSGWFNASADSPDDLHPYGYSGVALIAPRLFPLVTALLYPASSA